MKNKVVFLLPAKDSLTDAFGGRTLFLQQAACCKGDFMKHKITSMITALMMLSAAMLIAGCAQANGNDTKNPDAGDTSAVKDLQGVWKLMVSDTYIMHLYFDGSDFYSATEFNPGKFAKPPLSVTYKEDGTVLVFGQTLTPVKNGATIDLQNEDKDTVATMVKDSSALADAIKNAPELQDITIDELKGNVWKISKKEGGYVAHVIVDQDYKVMAACESPVGSGTFIKYDKEVSSPTVNSIKLDNDQWTLLKVGDDIYLTKGTEATIEKIADNDGSIFAKIKAVQ